MKRRFFAAAALLIGIVAAVVVAELALRANDHRPWQVRGRQNEATRHEYDPVLGWRNKPGTYRVRRYAPWGKETTVTVWPDGGRATSPRAQNPNDARPRMVILGGSYTLGWALSDEETYPWKLQSRFPEWSVSNYGCAGYGTYQSLLLLEREFRKAVPPELVVYALIPHHEIRNVAPLKWLRGLSSMGKRGHIFVPYVEVGEGNTLEQRPPTRYPVWPFSDRSALIALAQDRYATWRHGGRPLQGQLATQLLLSELDSVSRRGQARLLLVLLGSSRRQTIHHSTFLQDRGIAFVECMIPDLNARKVPGEMHPDDSANTLWADCVEKKLREIGA